MGFETILLERDEGFAVITLNRPPANAISEALIREINEALNALHGDASVRAVVITGAGERIFCGGADLGSAFSGGDVEAFIGQVADPKRRADAEEALDLMRSVSGTEPEMWGPTMVGFGRQPYRTADGKDRETFAIGLAPRNAANERNRQPHADCGRRKVMVCQPCDLRHIAHRHFAAITLPVGVGRKRRRRMER